jgi:hypothetical protein
MQSEPEAAGMQIGDARQTLLEIDRVRRDTRRDLHPIWFSNLVVGAFFAGATILALVADSATVVNLYWAIGIPLGFALIVRFEVRRERRIGAESSLKDPALLVWGLILAGVLAMNAATGSDAAWGYPVALGWLAIAAVYRDALMCTAGVALLAITTAVIAVEPVDAWAWVQLPMAGLLIAAGLVGRAWEAE